jgi:hypothetical protein
VAFFCFSTDNSLSLGHQSLNEMKLKILLVCLLLLACSTNLFGHGLQGIGNGQFRSEYFMYAGNSDYKLEIASAPRDNFQDSAGFPIDDFFRLAIKFQTKEYEDIKKFYTFELRLLCVNGTIINDSVNYLQKIYVKVIDIKGNSFLHRNNEWIKLGFGVGLGQFELGKYHYYATASFNLSAHTVRINDQMNDFNRNDFAGFAPSLDFDLGYASQYFSIRSFNQMKPIIWSETLWLGSSRTKAELILGKIFNPNIDLGEDDYFSIFATYEYCQTIFKDQTADFQQFSAGLSYSF